MPDPKKTRTQVLKDLAQEAQKSPIARLPMSLSAGNTSRSRTKERLPCAGSR
jgi:hypothetical protein